MGHEEGNTMTVVTLPAHTVREEAAMADDGNTTNEVQGYGQETREPSPDLRRLGRLVGTWELSGDVGGRVTYE